MKTLKTTNYAVILIFLILLFFIPHAKVCIPTSSVYEYLKIQDGLFTLISGSILISLLIYSLISYKNIQKQIKTGNYLIIFGVVFILAAVFQINGIEYGHAGNINFHFSKYNFQPGFYLMIFILTQLIINQQILKKEKRRLIKK